jgi:hypothetical protein
MSLRIFGIEKILWTACALCGAALSVCVGPGAAAHSDSGQGEVFPSLLGPYLGQKLPGRTPEVFAPGIISTGMDELNAVFSQDGTEYYFTVKLPDRGRHVMMSMRSEAGRWTAPVVLSFSGQYNDADPALSPDGKTLYFASSRPLVSGEKEKDWDIWKADRTGRGWSEPRNLGAPVNSPDMEVFPSVAANGTLYFSSGRPTGKGRGGIYMAKPVDDGFIEVRGFDEAINAQFGGGDIFIAPDESLIIFSSNRPGGFGNSDLYASFRGPDGSWSAPRNLGPEINSPWQEYCPSLSPDGKFFFFSSYKRNIQPSVGSYADILRIYRQPQTGFGDVYWVEAGFLEDLRPKIDK